MYPKPDALIDGKYRIVRLIAKGGMGAVFEGENIRIGRRVAIKILHPSVAEDRSLVARFEREAQAAARIGSDHIVAVLDLGELESGERYMVMELLDGETLRQRMERMGPMTPAEVLPIIAVVCDGLEHAHRAGIIHRDLKPENVFLARGRAGRVTVKILDFGVSKFHEVAGERPVESGTMLGTPRYMAPEQIRGDGEADHRADHYAVGAILFRSLAGRHPVEAATFHELMFKVALGGLPRLDGLVAAVDAALADVVARAMARDPADRFETAADLGRALRRWLRDRGHDEAIAPVPERSLHEPPAVRVDPEPTPVPQTKSRAPAPRPRVALGFALVAALGVVGAVAVVALRQSEVPPAPAVAALPTVEPRPAAPPAATATAVPRVAAPTATASASARPPARPPTKTPTRTFRKHL